MTNEEVTINTQAIEDDSDIIIDENFSYDGYQVVRGEFFAHMNEPGITFSNFKVNLNTACLRRLSDVYYVQFLVNPVTKTLAVRPCTEEDKDSFLWCNEKADGKRVPRYISCRLFFAKMSELMNWDPNYRYKILGKIVSNGSDYLIIFDLTATEMYERVKRDGTKSDMSRVAIFPMEWRTQFGLPVSEHQKLLKVNIFDGYTVFGVKNTNKKIIEERNNE